MTESTCETMSLPLFSVYGFSHPHSSKLTGYIGGNPVTVLMDSTASHNFISDKLVRSLGLSMFDIDVFNVFLGDGQIVSSNGLCKNLDVRCNGSSMLVDAYMLGLDGVDLILTCTSPAETKVDWGKMSKLLINRSFEELCVMGDSIRTLVRSSASRSLHIRYRGHLKDTLVFLLGVFTGCLLFCLVVKLRA